MLQATSLLTRAAALPQTWRSVVIGQIGQANVKLIRMGEEGIPDEVHVHDAELLVVIDGQMVLEIDGQSVMLNGGDSFLIPPGRTHRVLPGSRGTLLLVDADEPLPGQ